jgi:hypothetical protein
MDRPENPYFDSRTVSDFGGIEAVGFSACPEITRSPL